MTNQDPIAEHEAKILAHEKRGDEIAARLIAGEDAYAQFGEYVRTTTHLLRSAPDGDAKLRELRAEIDRLRAENERLRGRDAEPFDWDAEQTVVEWINENLPEREPRAGSKMVELHADEVVADRGEARRVAGWLKDIMAENARLQADLAAARADQAAMARRTGYSHCKFPMQCVSITTIGSGGYRSECTACGWKINGGVSPDSTDAVPAQQPEPKPDEPKDPNAWREARGVLKRGEPREPTESDLIDDFDLPMKPEVCGAPMRIVTVGTCASTKPCPTHDAEPVQWMAAGPDPDADTTDDDDESEPIVPAALVEYGKHVGLICKKCGYGIRLCRCHNQEKQDGTASKQSDPEVLRLRAPAGAPARDQQADRRSGHADGRDAAAECGDQRGPAQTAGGEGLLRAGEAVEAEPKPDAATRDGDEVLRDLTQWVDALDDRVRNLERGATRDGDEVLRTFLADPTWLTGKPALEEWCRRELARGGK